MRRGYVKLWRKSQESQVFQNAELWKVWTWCLMKAAHKPHWASLKTGKGQIDIFLEPGQFIFGRHSAAKKLKMKPSSVRNRIKKLENIENLAIKEDKQYSIISVCNWDIYQPTEAQGGQVRGQSEDNQRTIKGQSKDTKKNDKNGKEDIYVNQRASKNRKCPYQKMVEVYHEVLPELTEVRKLTDKRKTQAKKIWMDKDMDQDIEKWRSYLHHIRKSKFLMGRTGKWQADFEWITNYSNFVKIIEGKYHN